MKVFKMFIALPLIFIGMIVGFVKESLFAGYLYGIHSLDSLAKEVHKPKKP
jgi:hypothetical protein